MSGISSPSSSSVNQLRFDLKRMREDKEFWQAMASSLEQDVQNLTKDLAKLEKQDDTRDAALGRRFEREILELREANEGQSREIRRLRGELSDHTNDAFLLEEKENAHRRYADLESELADSEARQKKMKGENDEMKLLMRNLQRERQDGLNHLKRELAELRAAETSSKHTIELLQRSVRERIAEVIQTENSKNEEIAKLLKDVEEKEDIIRAKEGPEIQLRLDFSRLEDEHMALRQRLEDLTASLQVEEDERARLESEVVRLETEAEQNEKARQTLQQSLDAQSKAALSTYEELTQISAQCQKKREELESTVLEIADLKDKVVAFEGEVVRLQAEIKQSLEAHHNLTKSHEEQSELLAKVHVELAKLVSVCQQNEQEMAAAEASIEELKGDKQRMQETYEKTVQAIQLEHSCMKAALARRDAERLQRDDQLKELEKALDMLKMEKNAEKELKENALLRVEAQEEEIAALKRELLLTHNSQDSTVGQQGATCRLSKWSSQPSEFGSTVLPQYASQTELASPSSRSESSFRGSRSQFSRLSTLHIPNLDEADVMASGSIPTRSLETQSSPTPRAPAVSNFERTRTVRYKFFQDSQFRYNQDTPTRARELANRNAQLPPHMKSSYPTEMTTSNWRHSTSSNQPKVVPETPPKTPPSSGTELIKKTSAVKGIFRRSIHKKRRKDGEKGLASTSNEGSPAPRHGPLKGKHKPAESFEILNSPKKKKKI
ncbi:hypothetical protein RvY_14060 [Ramazzottius varieornatus]|uniref:Uncharacterized protein n=1 Tax=Ramazzottius varieornatus TaxID=947166 RepID=A0A1D1VS34_RAMVA|nr:hypothetical protein RvY_14060 [Ramazzottius varieornatus]